MPTQRTRSRMGQRGTASKGTIRSFDEYRERFFPEDVRREWLCSNDPASIRKLVDQMAREIEEQIAAADETS